MVHLVEHGRLQPDQITRHREVEYLALSAFEQLEAYRPPGQNRIEVRAVLAVHENRRAGINGEFADLERFDEIELITFEFAERVVGTKSAFRARQLYPALCASILLVLFLHVAFSESVDERRIVEVAR